MTPERFIALWKYSNLTERGAKKSGGGDVWIRHHFGWENKTPARDLGAALKQLTDFALQLENPPLLVVGFFP
jgi:hypothetical protein